jgi:hypothetical protein
VGERLGSLQEPQSCAIRAKSHGGVVMSERKQGVWQ